MFGKWVNNYYYGKSGKGDFRKDDLPQNRWQLFWAMLRVRLSGLCRLNLTVFAVWLPLIILIGRSVLQLIDGLAVFSLYEHYLATGEMGEHLTAEAIAALEAQMNGASTGALLVDLFQGTLSSFCLWCIPCILITGPVQCGLAYVSRNWARDEHAFAWSDFKDAVKANWKQGLVISGITSLMPIIVYTSWMYYGQMAEQNMIFMVPQMLVVTMALVWTLSLVFMYPIIVQYEVKTMALIKNGLMLAVARLPQTVGIRLLTLVPALIAVAVFYFTFSEISLLILAFYYILIGFALVRFIFASFTNGVFDKFINAKMEGVEVNRGMATDLDDDDDDEEDDETLLSE